MWAWRADSDVEHDIAGYAALAVKICPFLERIAAAILTPIAVTATRTSGV